MFGRTGHEVRQSVAIVRAFHGAGTNHERRGSKQEPNQHYSPQSFICLLYVRRGERKREMPVN